ncbi:hypothetical protein M2282_005777 [Variovorax boronicumulans]|uniref:hypothetical protein n=1 Tax=Variovorax boronicumulans TaxID=436515 RepID=UPI0024759EAE|nr:hypothetical protein [Variovorax boronicumulans]MDH6170602.1 hypothetical protein [Variovorax boronicumulans]
MTHAFALPRLLVISAAALALVGGPAMAESQYGYTTTVGAQVTATARVNLSIVVPKLILLRVGSTTAGGDTLGWTSGFDIPPTPVANSNQNYAWSGAAPVATTSANPGALLASAWTNSSGGGDLSYTATAFGTGGPTLANITVTSAASTGAALNHPLPAALATASTTVTHFNPNALSNSNWTYALAGTPGTWQAGTYTSTVTYTATSL